MYLLEENEFFYRNSSDLDAGVEGSVLLNNGFYYSFTLFETFTDWKEIDVLEEQYSVEQIEELEKELLRIYKRNRQTAESPRPTYSTTILQLPYS